VVDPDTASLHPDTVAVLAGRGERRPDAPLNPPVVFSSTYHAGGPMGYGRDGNPTWTAFEELLGALEGGSALVYSSGMAAAAAILEGWPVGSTVVVPSVAYFGTRSLLADRAAIGRFQLRTTDITDTAGTLSACAGADLLWIESPTNPLLGIADIAALARGAQDLGLEVVVDNTFATPLLQRPLDLGADVVMHSVTKLLAGHSDILMGATVTRRQDIYARLLHHREMYGAIPGPMEAFLAVRGVRTLPVRMDRSQSSAGILATRLKAHPAVTQVRYPGLPTHPEHMVAKRQMRGYGSLLAFEVAGGAADAERVAESVRIITHATSLGGVESLMERRHRWPGEDATPPTLLRLSVGCEHVDDLWSDLEQALATVPTL
jgi:cystathionine gamma-synthase